MYNHVIYSDIYQVWLWKKDYCVYMYSRFFTFYTFVGVIENKLHHYEVLKLSDIVLRGQKDLRLPILDSYNFIKFKAFLRYVNYFASILQWWQYQVQGNFIIVVCILILLSFYRTFEIDLEKSKVVSPSLQVVTVEGNGSEKTNPLQHTHYYTGRLTGM